MKGKQYKKIKFVVAGSCIVMACFFLFPDAADAMSRISNQTGAIAGESGANYGEAKDPRTIAARAINNILGLIGMGMVGFWVYAGVLWTSAAGNQDQVDKAKRIMKYNLIGTIIIFMAYAVTYFIATALSRASVEPTIGEWEVQIGDEPDRYNRPNVYRTPSNEAYYNDNR